MEAKYKSIQGDIDFKYVGVATDFFRSSVNGLSNVANIRNATFRMFRPAIEQFGAMLSFIAPLSEGGNVDVAELMRCMNLPTDVYGWASAVNCDVPHDKLNLIGDVSKFDFILSYGATPALMKILDDLSIPFLDIEVAPIRYCPDLFWVARTNHKDVERCLIDAQVDNDFFYEEAARVMAALSFRGVDYYGDSNLTYGAFAGQFDIDLALVCNGRIANIESYGQEIFDAFMGVDRVLFLPHPYNKSGVSESYFKNNFQNYEISQESSYRVLACHNVRKVVTLSSSLADEAVFFGKEAKKLITPDASQGPKRFIVGQEITSRAFWRACKNGERFQKRDLQPSSIERIIGMRWGLQKLF